MRLKFIIAILIITPQLQAQQQGPSTIDSLGGRFLKAVSPVLMPEQKKALVAYMNMLGVGLDVPNSDVAGTNTGLQAHFDGQFQTDSCFREKMYDFYGKISQYIRSRKSYKKFNSDAPYGDSDACSRSETNYGENAMLVYDCPDQERLTIDRKIGKGVFSEYEPGWVWKLAIETSGGDALQALNLIAACGNDDESGGFSYQKVNPALKRNILNCPPRDSVFYAQGGLGADVDIDDNFKKKIVDIQSQSSGDDIPGKYYHVYSSAFLACHLISNGFSKGITTSLEKDAAFAYRSITKCDENAGLLAQRPTIQALQKMAKKQNKSLEDFLASKLGLYSQKSCDNLSGDEKVVCTFLSPIATAKDFKVDKENIMESLMGIDAATLYKKWFVGGTTYGIDLPCTDMRLLGPSNLMKSAGTLEKVFLKPSGWSDERYNNARKLVASWKIDFDWTITQHNVGAQFAAKNCSNQAAPLNFCPQKKTPQNSTARPPGIR